jgi:Papain family cysteine protease/Cathepsin propeptide inhibitor domain (I29)
MDAFLRIPEHPSKRNMDLKICSAISLLLMIGIIYLQYHVTGLYDTTENDIKLIFEDWKIHYGRSYINREEEDYKFKIFRQNYKEINRWNYDTDKLSKLALNEFADLSSEEFRLICCSYTTEDEGNINITRSDLSSDSSHTSFNWSKSVEFLDSKIELHDSWAASIVSSIESIYSIYQSKKISLSVDQLPYCMNENSVPKSGNFTGAYNYVMDYGLMLSDGSRNKLDSCNYDPEQDFFTIRGYKFLPYNDNHQLVLGVSRQPIVAAIQADQLILQFYSEGIIEAAHCGELVNQAILITGFGHDINGNDYWIAKNYWSKHWGQNGYFLLQRGEMNTCGVLSYASYALL